MGDQWVDLACQLQELRMRCGMDAARRMADMDCLDDLVFRHRGWPMLSVWAMAICRHDH